jgi:ABC-2 type transport system ATP-binding protein
MLQDGGLPMGAPAGVVLGHLASLHAAPLDAGRLARSLGLEPALGTTVRRLSGGQRQRLALAAAVVGRPELVFLDEPTAGLDPQARIAVWDVVRTLREAGVAVVLTTHLMEEAERHCDRLAIMDHGHLVAQGVPAELIAAHDADGIEDVFVAVTGMTIEEGGSIRDVKRQRRIARRLG